MHERMRKLVALPILSADALSSVAYGSEAMLAILVLALHIRPTEEEAARFREYWGIWRSPPLELVVSPYRALVAPTVAYIESLTLSGRI